MNEKITYRKNHHTKIEKNEKITYRKNHHTKIEKNKIRMK